MTQESGTFDWTEQAERAAELVARDEFTQETIADTVGVARKTLYRWRQHPDFDARVQSYVDDFCKAVRKRGIAILERRVDALNDRWMRMRRIIAERGDAPEMAGIPGGTTGLLVHNVKSVGFGPTATLVDLYEVDTGLLKELREHEKQAAMELGQWATPVGTDDSIDPLDDAENADDEFDAGAAQADTVEEVP